MEEGGGGGPQNYSDFNSSSFTNSIQNVSAVRDSLDFRSKRKMERGGSYWWDSSGFHVRWEEVPAWVPVSVGDPPFGQLHIVAYVPSRDGWYDWDIEDLERSGENSGTDFADPGSAGSEGSSPDSSFRLQNGDWFGLYIAGFPGGTDVRSDILPVQYNQGGGRGGSSIPSYNEINVIDPGTESVLTWREVVNVTFVPGRRDWELIDFSWDYLSEQDFPTWPVGPGGNDAIGLLWFIYYDSGEWRARGTDWIRPTRRDGAFIPIANLEGDYPDAGSVVGVFMAGPSRFTNDEPEYRYRTNIQWFQWSDMSPVTSGRNSSGLGNDIPSPPAININDVVWIDQDVSSWAQTATLSSVTFPSSGRINLDYDKANTWLEIGNPPMVANSWIFVYRNNQWYGGTWEWMRPEQTEKFTENLDNNPGVLGKLESEKELTNFIAQFGDEYYFMMSGLVRGGSSNVQERSNLLRVRWF